MSKYQDALDWVRTGNDSCGVEWDFIQELVDKMTIPYANDKGGYSCRNCDFGVLYGEKHCSSCGTSLDWGDND